MGQCTCVAQSHIPSSQLAASSITGMKVVNQSQHSLGLLAAQVCLDTPLPIAWLDTNGKNRSNARNNLPIILSSDVQHILSTDRLSYIALQHVAHQYSIVSTPISVLTEHQVHNWIHQTKFYDNASIARAQSKFTQECNLHLQCETPI